MTVEERIKALKSVRDIPYYIAIDNEQDYCCTTKSLMLQKLLKSLGIESRIIICKFNWQDYKIPPEILQLFKDKEESHQYLEVKIPETNQWVKVDPTWDSKLAYFFPIADWDGINDTVLAVKPIRVYSPEESLKMAEEDENSDEAKDFFARNKDFYIAFNRWLEKERTEK